MSYLAENSEFLLCVNRCIGAKENSVLVLNTPNYNPSGINYVFKKKRKTSCGDRGRLHGGGGTKLED